MIIAATASNPIAPNLPISRAEPYLRHSGSRRRSRRRLIFPKTTSLNVLLTSHAWRNDHNGFSHQATGYVDNALARRSEVIRVYYPPDLNRLLSVFDHCLRSRNYVNVVTCGKQPQLQWLNMDEALEHC